MLLSSFTVISVHSHLFAVAHENAREMLAFNRFAHTLRHPATLVWSPRTTRVDMLFPRFYVFSCDFSIQWMHHQLDIVTCIIIHFFTFKNIRVALTVYSGQYPCRPATASQLRVVSRKCCTLFTLHNSTGVFCLQSVKQVTCNCKPGTQHTAHLK